MKEVLFLLLGWFLGLFGPWLSDRIRKPFKRAELRKSLFIELRDLRLKLAAVVLGIASNHGSLDRSLIEWVEEIMRSDKAEYEPSSIPDGLKLLLEHSDEDLQTLAEMARARHESFSFKKYSLPFLSSQMSSLSTFSPEFQRLAIDIQSKLAILNDEIDFYRFHFEQTFDSSLSNASRQAGRTQEPRTELGRYEVALSADC